MKARAASGKLWSPRIYTSAAWHLDSTKSVLENVAAYKAVVVLTGNPLVDIRHTGDIAGVMVAGRWLSRAAIERRLDTYYRGMILSGRD